MSDPEDRCHPLIAGRLMSLRQALMALFDAGATMSNASRGTERELFVSSFLAQVFPPSVRFGSGDITDEVVAKFNAVQELKVLERKYSPEEKSALLQNKFPGLIAVPVVSPVDPVKERKGGVPFVCVGFEGWSDVDTVRDHARSVGSVLVLRHAIYAGVGGSAKGPVALLMFLEYLSSLIQNASVTIFPTWHYGSMSRLRVEHPELFAEGEQSSLPDSGIK